MMKAKTLADALGRKNIAEAVAVTATAVSNAVVRGWFPPSWYVSCKALADEQGKACPPDLFKMRDENSRAEAS